MKIVVEGYDGTGKSTLVKALAERLGLNHVSAGGPPASDELAILDCQKQLAMRNTVHDRITCLSRQAYQLDNSPDHVRALVQYVGLFTIVGTIFIHAEHIGDEHELKEHDTEEHIKHITDNKEVICENYRRLFEAIPHFKFDFRVHTLEDVLCYIEQTAKRS